jgi:hypothetical protein
MYTKTQELLCMSMSQQNQTLYSSNKHAISSRHATFTTSFITTFDTCKYGADDNQIAAASCDLTKPRVLQHVL